MKLPSDAVKAILPFMTREQLNAFSLLSRQIAGLIHSPPFAAKPLLFVDWADIRRALCTECNSRKCGHMGVEVDFNIDRRLRLPAFTHLGVHLDSMIHQQWLRFKGESDSDWTIVLGFLDTQSPYSVMPFRVLYQATAGHRGGM